jgi:hypothetical protein
MAMLEPDRVHIGIATNGNEHTAAVFRSRAEMRELVSGARDAVALSRQLIAEIDSALPGVSLRQPKLEALPADLRHLSNEAPRNGPSGPVRFAR